jgi:hypothetical protein
VMSFSQVMRTSSTSIGPVRITIVPFTGLGSRPMLENPLVPPSVIERPSAPAHKSPLITSPILTEVERRDFAVTARVTKLGLALGRATSGGKLLGHERRVLARILTEAAVPTLSTSERSGPILSAWGVRLAPWEQLNSTGRCALIHDPSDVA